MNIPKQSRIDKGLYWDRAWSIVEGCAPVSSGCKHCWSASATAMRACQKNPNIRERYSDLIVPGSKPPMFNGSVQPMWLDIFKPTPKQKPAVWAVWNDLFHINVPFNFKYKAFERMLLCPQHFFIVCTKRPELMAKAMPDIFFHLGRNYKQLGTYGLAFPLKNVMAMTTAENQDLYDERWAIASQIPAVIKAVSIEPALEYVNIDIFAPWPDWVIIGCETGPNRRKTKLRWIEDIVVQCIDAKIPVFVKQAEINGKIVKTPKILGKTWTQFPKM